MDTKAVNEDTELNLELAEQLELEDHEEKSYDPRNTATVRILNWRG